MFQSIPSNSFPNYGDDVRQHAPEINIKPIFSKESVKSEIKREDAIGGVNTTILPNISRSSQANQAKSGFNGSGNMPPVSNIMKDDILRYVVESR